MLLKPLRKIKIKRTKGEKVTKGSSSSGKKEEINLLKSLNKQVMIDLMFITQIFFE